MDVIAEECLINKQILSPDCQNFLHVDLLDTIDIELILFLRVVLIIFTDVMLLETYLVKVDTI